jgi:hypothetical protein
MKFDDVPRLTKLPFILGDIALLLLAAAIADRHSNPFAPLPLLLITGCVVVGCVLSVIPFVVNYVRDREEVAAALRRELSEQFRKLMSASEHLQHSTAQLKTIEEVATKNLQVAEKLPYRLQEKIAEFNQQLAETESEEREALEQELAALRSAESERLASVADKIVKTTSEWAKLEAEARKQLAATTQHEEKLAGVLAAIDAKLVALETAVKNMGPIPVGPPPAPSPLAVPVAPPPAAPPPILAAQLSPRVLFETTPPYEPAPAGGGVAGTATPEPAPAAVPKPRKPRAPRKPKTEEPAPAAESPAPAALPQSGSEPAGEGRPELIAEPVAEEPSAPENFSQVPPEEQPTATPSSDGRTRLTVTSYIGIGNKLHLRGEGPGLSWDKGVPLQFVSIGRWRWETGEATAPVTCKIYKNDKIEAPIGPLNLAPGTELDVTAPF